MEKMTLASKTFAKDTRGANLVEYVLLVGLVAIICLVGFRTFGQSINNKIEEQSSSVDGIPG